MHCGELYHVSPITVFQKIHERVGRVMNAVELGTVFLKGQTLLNEHTLFMITFFSSPKRS